MLKKDQTSHSNIKLHLKKTAVCSIKIINVNTMDSKTIKEEKKSKEILRKANVDTVQGPDKAKKKKLCVLGICINLCIYDTSNQAALAQEGFSQYA